MNAHLAQILLLATLTLSAPAWAQFFTKEETEHEARVARVYADVNEGDSKARVLEVAGEPETITPATEAEDEIWIYFSENYNVSIYFKDGKVTSKAQRFINIKESPVAEPSRF